MAGASLQAAALLCGSPGGPPRTADGADAAGDVSPPPNYSVAINWGGGRHHASSCAAGGFCFVNDAVLACSFLNRNLGRVLYVDIDIHHCDGVQEAFYGSDRVLTCSLHRYAPGFFPGTGSAADKGAGSGWGYCVNLPMPDNITDDEFGPVFERALLSLTDAFQPSAVVLAVGADGLADDPLVGSAGWSLSSRGISGCVRTAAVLCDRRDIRLLVLGGGGYDDADTARTFLACTAAACCGIRPSALGELPEYLPEHKYVRAYGPDIRLHTPVVRAAGIHKVKCFVRGKQLVDSLTALDLAAEYIQCKQKSFNSYED